MLVVNQCLRELHLGKMGMTDCGVERLTDALRTNYTLKYLDLRWYTHTVHRHTCPMHRNVIHSKPIHILTHTISTLIITHTIHPSSLSVLCSVTG